MQTSVFLAIAMGLASLQTPPMAVHDFDLPPPGQTGRTFSLYATHYRVHAAEPGSAEDVPLRGRSGEPLGVTVSQRDFCFGALQGTLRIRSGPAAGTYNVNGLAPGRSAECDFGGLSSADNSRLGRQGWARVSGNAAFGLGVDGLRLVPFRTIAVDRRTMAIGTVLFVPRLRDVEFVHEGRRLRHDGYVIAGDVGSAIKGNHVDFFTGTSNGPPPSIVTSREDGLFDAEVVTDPAIIERLTTLSRHVR